jgi:hypothetical protein
MKKIVFIFIYFLLIILHSCKKTDTITKLLEDKISFTVTPNSSSTIFSTPYDTVSFIISITSKIPESGVKVSLNVFDPDKKQTFVFDSSTQSNTLSILTTSYELNKKYTVKINVTSKSESTNTLTQEISVERKRFYKNYLKSSYELSNFDEWLSSNDLYDNGMRYTRFNPFMDIQYAQLDINGDGREDILYYEGYDINIVPTPNPPPVVFINSNNKLAKIPWSGPNLKSPHGVKLLVGDYNKDTFPDVFSLVNIDAPYAGVPSTDFCHLLFNSENGFNKVKEFDDQTGYWVTGSSGDIDKDGDLDVVIFNFSYLSNFVTSKILWNDGKGVFTYDDKGIGKIPIVQECELVDMNNDGYLDLVIDRILVGLSYRQPEVVVMWGNGAGFDLSNSSSFIYDGKKYVIDLDFVDIDNDGIKEILNSGYLPEINKYYIDIYKSEDKGKSFIDKSLTYIENNPFGRFGHIYIRDLDNNGKIDILTSDKKDNIRWEWNGTKFVRK